MRLHQKLRKVASSPLALGVAVAVTLIVPVLTLPRLPHVDPWPVVIGLLPWIVGKYLLCPLRWRALTGAGHTRWWHIRAYAESELFGLMTPGHVGADLWRIRRLTTSGLQRGDAVLSVGLDRFVGAVGLIAFVVVAGVSLPPTALIGALSMGLVLLGAVFVVRRIRPDLMPTQPLPRPRQFADGLVLSACYQLSIAGLLLGTLAATGYTLSPLAVLGAFGASQAAGAIPGPHGASPRDGALVLALVALGIPWLAATATVALKAALAWLPALALGGVSLVFTRRAAARLTAAGLTVAPAPG